MINSKINSLNFKNNSKINDDFLKIKNIINKVADNFVYTEEGQGLTEYALLIFLIGIGMMLIIHQYCHAIKNTYQKANDQFDSIEYLMS